MLEKENQQSGKEYGSALVSPMTTLNRDAIPVDDDIESEFRADVETGNEEEEEESLEEGIPTFEMI